jgi:hypothetical protein
LAFIRFFKAQSLGFRPRLLMDFLGVAWAISIFTIYFFALVQAKKLESNNSKKPGTSPKKARYFSGLSKRKKSEKKVRKATKSGKSN